MRAYYVTLASMFETREALLACGWDWYSAQSVMPIVRPLQIASGEDVPLFSFSELKQQLEDTVA